MRNDRRRPVRGRAGAPARRAKRPADPKTQRGGRPSATPSPAAPSRDAAASTERGVFRLGAIPGATPGKWLSAWKERMPDVDIELIPISFADQRERLDELDAALVRLPLERRDDLHVIPLYDEVPVVVASADSHLMATDQLTADDLVGEVLITPADDVLGPLSVPTIAPDFAPLATTEDAVATVASGVGIVIVPMSLARLHHRRDADYRPLLAGPTSTVALAWRREATTPDVDAFVGIVRGRTPNSSR